MQNVFRYSIHSNGVVTMSDWLSIAPLARPLPLKEMTVLASIRDAERRGGAISTYYSLARRASDITVDLLLRLFEIEEHMSMVLETDKAWYFAEPEHLDRKMFSAEIVLFHQVAANTLERFIAAREQWVQTEQGTALVQTATLFATYHYAAAMKWLFLRHEPVPNTFWLGFHKHYAFSEEHNFATVLAPLFDAESEQQTSTQAIYLGALLLDLLNTGSMTTGQITLAFNWLAQWAVDYQLTKDKVASTESATESVLFVDFISAQGLRLHKGEATAATQRFLGIPQLVKQIENMRMQLRSGRQSIVREGGRDVPVEDQAGLLLAMERLYHTLQQAAAHNIEVRKQVMNVATRVFRGFKDARASLSLANTAENAAVTNQQTSSNLPELSLSLPDAPGASLLSPSPAAPQSKGFTLSLVPVTSKEDDFAANITPLIPASTAPTSSSGATAKQDAQTDANPLPVLNFSNVPQGGGAGTMHVAHGQEQSLVSLYESAPLWRARDISSKGFGFSVGANEVRVPPQLGELLGLLPPMVKHPLLGVVVRKINDPQTNEITLGVEILSPRPLPVTVHRVPAIAEEQTQIGTDGEVEEISPQAPVPNESMVIPAIFAPGLEFDGRLDTLVLPANKFSTADNYIIESGGNKFRIVVNRVVRKSDDWVALRFEVREQL
jgi:hypothetical protein